MEILFLLGHPIRWRIVEILAAGAHTAGEIADALWGERRVERTVVSHQLRRLRDAEVVHARRDAAHMVYRLDPRVTGLMRLAAEGLDAMAHGGTYDDIALGDHVIAGCDDYEHADDPRETCWCIQKISKSRHR